jgi:hypothetical protein
VVGRGSAATRRVRPRTPGDAPAAARARAGRASGADLPFRPRARLPSGPPLFLLLTCRPPLEVDRVDLFLADPGPDAAVLSSCTAAVTVVARPRRTSVDVAGLVKHYITRLFEKTVWTEELAAFEVSRC